MPRGGQRDGLASVQLVFCGQVLTRHAVDGGFVVGREAPSDVRIDHPAISRLHAHIWPGRCWKLIDYDSRNGIYVQGQRIRGEVDIVDGMTAALGAREGIEVTFTLVPPGVSGPNAAGPDARVVNAVCDRADELGLRLQGGLSGGSADLAAVLACLRTGHWPAPGDLAALEATLAWPAGALQAIGAGRPAQDLTEVITPHIRQALVLDSAVLSLNEIQAAVSALSAVDAVARAGLSMALRRRLDALESVLRADAAASPACAELLGAIDAYRILVRAIEN